MKFLLSSFVIATLVTILVGVLLPPAAPLTYLAVFAIVWFVGFWRGVGLIDFKN
ncbi:MAG TPA: hypothetical protein VEU47_13995 [Candidatus Cybelea sp.]|nr:hypothetical protein [Candidatus Cybelea sp.]